MKPTVRIITFTWMVIVLLLMFAGCSPVKRVLRNEDKTEQVVREYLRKHPSKNDTTLVLIPGVPFPVFVKIKDSTQRVPCDTFTRVTPGGTRVTVDQNKDLKIENLHFKSDTLLRVDTVYKKVIDRTFAQAYENTISKITAENQQHLLKIANLENFKRTVCIILIAFGVILVLVLWVRFKTQALDTVKSVISKLKPEAA
jgi:hypothetical protein